MSEALDHVRQVCAEYDRANPGWREDARERQERAFEKRKREAETEQQARKAREAEKQQVVATDWYAAVDGRFNEHLKSWLWGAIDDRIQQHLDRHGDIFKDAVGAALGTIRKQMRDEFKGADEQLQRALEAKLAEQKERLLASNNPADRVQEQAQLRAEVKRAIEELVGAVGVQLRELEERLRATPGRLPVAKDWIQESVTYQAEFVCHDGSLWQACKDTAQAPGGSDWVCVARAGHDAVTPSFRGGFDAHKTYARLDIVEYDGTSYLARRDAPGVPGIPGDGWQLMSRSGRRGPVGERGPQGSKGERGARGEAAPTIITWTIDREHYRAIPTMSDGKPGAPLELRPLFEQFNDEAVGPATDAAVTTALKDVTRANPGLLAPL